MRIGIDIDDTITDTSVHIRAYVEENLHRFPKMYELEEGMRIIMKGKYTEEIEEFMKPMGSLVKKVSLKEDVIDVFNTLKSEGHEIYLITARYDDVLQNAEEDTKEYLRLHGVPYDMLIMGAHKKLDTCREHKIDIMIDDSVDTCEEIYSSGIKTLLFTSPVNEKLETNVPRMEKWSDFKNLINM